MDRGAAPGSIVAWWDEGSLAFAVVAGEEKQRFRLVLPGGREERVPGSRIAFDVERAGPVPGTSVSERLAAGRRAAAATAAAGERARDIDVAVLWEIAREEGVEHDLGSLAALALGEAGGPARAAVALALLGDGIRFERRGERWETRSLEKVEGILRQEERVARRAREQEGAQAALRAAVRGEPWQPTGSEEERRYLAALEDLCVHDLRVAESTRALALAALEAAGVTGDRPAEKAFRLLRKIGRFESDDENLIVLRHRLRTEFPEDVLEAARHAAARGFSHTGRADLTHLDLVTVDSERTREIDDALSIESVAGGRRVGIHIADPSAFVDPGDAIDREAFARATSHYLPDLRLPMLPPEVSEERASLLPAVDRPTLSFFVELDETGGVRGFELVRGIVRSRARIDYAEADRIMEQGEGAHAHLLRALHAALGLHESKRIEAGALVLEVPETDVHVSPDGRVELEPLEAGSPSRRLVTEAMILAGAIAARFCAERGIPILFRRQSAPGQLPDRAPGAITDPVTIRTLRRSLRRGEIALEGEPHFALGLPAYAQVTSPLRRYQDMVSHRQILAALAGLPLPYSVDALRAVAATTEEADGEARQAERSADLYWRLRYLEQSGARIVEGIVVDVRPVVVQLSLTLLEEKVPALAGAKLGERVTLRIERVNPRAELLVLRPA